MKTLHPIICIYGYKKNKNRTFKLFWFMIFIGYKNDYATNKFLILCIHNSVCLYKYNQNVVRKFPRKDKCIYMSTFNLLTCGDLVCFSQRIGALITMAVSLKRRCLY